MPPPWTLMTMEARLKLPFAFSLGQLCDQARLGAPTFERPVHQGHVLSILVKLDLGLEFSFWSKNALFF